MTERVFVNVDPATVMVVMCPDGRLPERFLGLKAGENMDGSIRVQLYGPAPNDLSECVCIRNPLAQVAAK